jgi:hypothetical protein
MQNDLQAGLCTPDGDHGQTVSELHVARRGAATGFMNCGFGS